jgi:hypothetical protein
MRISVLSFTAVVLTGSVFAQQPAATSFVLSESGANGTYITTYNTTYNPTSLATLMIGGDGTVTGTEIVQLGGSLVTYAVQGILATNDDGTKTLSFSGPSTDTVDVNGDPLVSSESLRLVSLPNGGYIAFRTDAGQFASGNLYPAVSAPASGTYVVTGTTADPSAISVDLLSFDSAGNISGNRVQNALGAVTQQTLRGSYQSSANGFYTIQLNVPSTDADGNAVMNIESYLALPNSRNMRMIRVDRAAGLLTLAN